MLVEGNMDDLETFSRQAMAAYAEKVAHDLEHIAGLVRDRAKKIDKVAGESSAHAPFAEIANGIQSEVIWGVANLNTERLTLLAAEIDTHRATRSVN